MFKRKKKQADHLRRTSLLQIVAFRLIALQRRWADWLQVKTRHWQPRQQKRFLFILCLVMGSLSTLSFLQLFKDAPETTTSNRLTTPQPLPPLIHLPPEPALPELTDTMVFHRFRAYIDSLVQTPEGRKKYEQFLRERPGFMDSVAFAEQMSRQSFPQHNKQWNKTNNSSNNENENSWSCFLC